MLYYIPMITSLIQYLLLHDILLLGFLLNVNIFLIYYQTVRL